MAVKMITSGWMLKRDQIGPGVGSDVGRTRKRGVRNDSKV